MLTPSCSEKWQNMTFCFLNPSPLSTYETEASATRRLETAQHAATDELTVAMWAVRNLELKLNIGQTWTEADPEYQETKKYLQHRDFHRTLDHVQQLVVQRLFEMSKANIVGMGNVVSSVNSILILHYTVTGYKMRTSIWKALKWRGKAIRTAIDKYNKLTINMNPLAPLLDWKNIVNYTFISEFKILWHSYSCADLTSHPWILPANREIASRYFKVVRARKEMHRLNIEICCLYTAIHDDQHHFLITANSLVQTDPVQAAEIRDIYRSCARINQIHLTRLRAIMQLPGYLGSTDHGIRASPVGEHSEPNAADDGPSALEEPGDTRGITYDIEEDLAWPDAIEDELDDSAWEELVHMGQFIEDMAMAPDEDEVPRSRHGVPLSMLGSFRI